MKAPFMQRVYCVCYIAYTKVKNANLIIFFYSLSTEF